MKKPKIELKAGQAFATDNKLRWILGVGNGHVLYSRGGDSHLECKESTFRRWLRKATLCNETQATGR
jgi:hypothetical protein